jgi:NADH:ubiquinone reductase (H+-translocating)
MRLTGLVAWLAWLTIHLFFLIGFKNRLLVLLEWAWAYFAYDRGARMITQAWRAAGSDAIRPASSAGASRRPPAESLRSATSSAP